MAIALAARDRGMICKCTKCIGDGLLSIPFLDSFLFQPSNHPCFLPASACHHRAMTFESLRSKIRAIAGQGSGSASELDHRPSTTSLKRTASSVDAMDSTHGDLDPLYSSRKRMRITFDTPPSPPPELNPFNASAVNALESMFGRVIALAASAKTPLSSSSSSYRTPLSKLQEQQRQLQQQRARERQSKLQREQALAQSRAKDHTQITASTVPQREFTFSLTNGHPQQTPAIQSAWSQLLGKSTEDSNREAAANASTGYKFMLPPTPGAVPPPTVVKEAPHPQHRTVYNFGGQAGAMRVGASTAAEPRKAQAPPTGMTLSFHKFFFAFYLFFIYPSFC